MRAFQAICLTVAIATVISTAASADVQLTRLFAITRPVGGREFSNPQGVAIDSARGDVYVADTGNGRIEILTKDGYRASEFSHKREGSADGSTEPVGVVIDSRGDVYVTDSSSPGVWVYDSRGRFRQRIDLPSTDGKAPVPGRMAIDSAGSLYVVDRGAGTILVIDPKGTLKMRVGSAGTGEGQFKMLSDVSVDSKGNIYALDSLGTPLQVFDPKGRFVFGFGVHATGEGNFAHPTAVEVDSSGNIWIVDSFTQLVSVFDPKGKFLKDFGGFFFPVDLAYAPDSKRLYVLEKNGHRLLGFQMTQQEEKGTFKQ